MSRTTSAPPAAGRRVAAGHDGVFRRHRRQLSVFARLFGKLVPLRAGEAAPTLLATAYGFCILFAFYLLRPVRDEIGAADRGNLQLLGTAVFLVMLLAVPLYSLAVARLRGPPSSCWPTVSSPPT